MDGGYKNKVDGTLAEVVLPGDHMDSVREALEQRSALLTQRGHVPGVEG